ncbi:bacteriohemerythrin [Dongia sp.]|uniref:bacteriohemerythrin n=1 Tax=Dongia sp. TaxID=1977262 RepID=UPI0035AFACAC
MTVTSFVLLPSMRTGVDSLDAEHQDLVSAINRIGVAEQDGDQGALLVSLHAFRSELADHFANEEHYLRMLKYPESDAHVRHHSNVIIALDSLRENLGITPAGIAARCYTELLTAVVTKDMEFLNWLDAKRSKSGR